MNLESIKGKYDLVVGLGCNCMVAYQLKRLGLRKFATPIDTMLTTNVYKLSEAIKTDFKYFMRLRNLKFSPEMTSSKNHSYAFYDKAYQCYSGHDYSKKLPWFLWFVWQPSVKKRLNRRIHNFYRQIGNADSILFVRASGEFDDVEGILQLQAVLNERVKKDFKILNIIFGDKYGEIECLHDGICRVEFPFDYKKDKWQGDDKLWNSMMEGVIVEQASQPKALSNT